MLADYTMLPCKVELEDFMWKYHLWEYLAEPKLDGYRAKIIKSNDKVKILLRSNKDVTKKFPMITDYFKEINSNFILDGELINKDFTTLTKVMKTNSQDATSSFIAFDIIELNNECLVDYPFFNRRFLLDSLDVPRTPVFQFKNYMDFENAFNKIAEKFEGFVLKHKDSKYWNGKYWDWKKVKKFYTLDMKIIDKEEVANFGWKILCVGEGKEVWVRSSKEYPIGCVVEVKYQNLTKNSLRFASILRERIDKNVL